MTQREQTLTDALWAVWEIAAEAGAEASGRACYASQRQALAAVLLAAAEGMEAASLGLGEEAA